MPIQVLKLNLVPPPTLWRQYHETIGWVALSVGILAFAGTGALTWRAYAQAIKAGNEAVRTTNQAQKLARDQEGIIRNLLAIDVTKDLPRWRLAERYYSERTLRWSRLTAELERSLTKDVRLKSIQKIRGSDQQVQMKLRGEGRTREAEAAFVESLYENLNFFPQIILERESERQGGGVDFDITLAVNQLPPPYENLPIPPPVYRDQKGNVLERSHPAVKDWLAKGGAKSLPMSQPIPQPTPKPQPMPTQRPTPASPKAAIPTAPQSNPTPAPQDAPRPTRPDRPRRTMKEEDAGSMGDGPRLVEENRGRSPRPDRSNPTHAEQLRPNGRGQEGPR